MSADGAEDHGVCLRLNNGTAGRHGVSGGAGGGGNDHAVSRKAGHPLPVTPGADLHTVPIAMDHCIIQGIVGINRLAVPNQRYVQHRSSAYFILAPGRFNDQADILGLQRSHKAFGAQIYAQERDFQPLDLPGHGKNRSIAADDDDQRAVPGNIAQTLRFKIARNNTVIFSGKNRADRRFETCVV